MGELTNPGSWTESLLAIPAFWLIYTVLRPVRDFYVVQRLYFDRFTSRRGGADSPFPTIMGLMTFSPQKQYLTITRAMN